MTITGDANPKPPEKALLLQFIRTICLTIIEILAGHRNPENLKHVLTAETLERILYRAKLIHDVRTSLASQAPRALHQIHQNPQLGTVRVCQVSPHAFEACCVVQERVRTRAIALRIEYRGTSWVVTEVLIG